MYNIIINIFLTILILIIFLYSISFLNDKKNEIKNELKKDLKKDYQELIINVVKSLYVHNLEMCESGGRKNIVIVDTNKKKSYGAFQFQLNTFLLYGKKYNLLHPSTTLKEAENKIMDYELQKKLVHLMLNDGLNHHWFNCTKKINFEYPKK